MSRNLSHFSLLALLWLQGCSNLQLPGTPLETTTLARSDEFIVVTAGPSDSLSALAGKFYGDERKGWLIADFNRIDKIEAGQEVVIPLKHPNPTGIYPNGYQVIPILCYHRIGTKKDKMVVSPEEFSEQMAYLRDNDYKVLALSELIEFFQGTKPLPKNAVVITFDDGYKSSYDIAYPILKRLGFPATIFVYTDFIGATDALSWRDMREMQDSGLIDIQIHSKSHSNLALKQGNETDADYRKRVEAEVTIPIKRFRTNLGQHIHTFAYPYGDSNPLTIELLKKNHYTLAATVQKGSNPAFSSPYLLRRNMIYGGQKLEGFKKNLVTFVRAALQ